MAKPSSAIGRSRLVDKKRSRSKSLQITAGKETADFADDADYIDRSFREAEKLMEKGSPKA